MAAFKAQAMARALKEKLQLSLAGITITEFADASSFPLLMVEKGTAGTREAVFVKIEMLPDPAQHVDALGRPQPLYSPHKITILRENAAGAEAPQQPEMREKLSAECAQMGCKFFIYEKEAVRTATSAAGYDLTGATKVAEIGPDSRQANPLTNSQ